MLCRRPSTDVLVRTPLPSQSQTPISKTPTSPKNPRLCISCKGAYRDDSHNPSLNSTTPTEGELFKRFSPELQKHNLANRERRQRDYEDFVGKLKEYSKSDKPSTFALSFFPDRPTLPYPTLPYSIPGFSGGPTKTNAMTRDPTAIFRKRRMQGQC